MKKNSIAVPLVLAVALLSLFTNGCITSGQEVGADFTFETQATTPKGVQIDPTTNEVDPAAIDCIIDKVEACLIRKLGPSGVIPEALRGTAECWKPSFTLPIPRDRLRLKIPEEIPSSLVGLDWQPATREGLGWHLNCEGTQQILTLSAGDAGCTAKGLTPTNTCPCRWRANMLDKDTIVATPSLYLFPDWLIRWATGCRNPWGNPVFAECAKPLTGPLDRVAACKPE